MSHALWQQPRTARQCQGQPAEPAQDIYREAFNSAWDEYEDPAERRGDDAREEVSHKVAWAAVKQKYEKDAGQWRAKD